MADATPDRSASAVQKKDRLCRPVLREVGPEGARALGVELRAEHQDVALTAAVGVHLDVHLVSAILRHSFSRDHLAARRGVQR
eukprot:854906-Prymnesium_polylepis.1